MQPDAVPEERFGLVVHLPRRDQVSPELVLVDPELAALERRRLYEPGWFRPARSRVSVTLHPPLPPTPVSPPTSPPRLGDAEAVEAERRDAAPPGLDEAEALAGETVEEQTRDDPPSPPSAAFVFRPRWALEGGMQRVGLDWPLVRPSKGDALAYAPLFEPTRRIGRLARPHRRQLATTAATLLLGVGGASLLWLLAEQTPPVTSQQGVPGTARPGLQQPPPPARTSAPTKRPPATPSKPSLVPPVSVPARPTGQEPAGPKSAAPTAAAPRPTAPPPAPAPASGIARTLAWAPVASASGYQVELFRGSDRVLQKRTTEPRLDIGPTWRHAGKTFSLEPGSYLWYVWPLLEGGTRGEVATVRAKLVIGPN
jgi:hypothetical protein